MRLIWAFIWSMLLSSMIVYVISNMSATSFNLTSAIVLGIAFLVTIVVLGDGLIKDEDA